ncbi:MAG: RagB/SusD family nutrient uptake outer membrane protein [Alistipes sp.]|nr:RagB/SusD family nutrient uptake outer membrane protein [Candidatus Minthomonas equi]
MKKNIYILLAAAASLFFAGSCNERIEEHPKAVATSTFYNTPSEADAAINAVIAQFRGLRDMNFGGLMETFSDYNFGRASWAPNSTYQTLDAKNVTRTDDQWNRSYSTIRDANICIAQLPQATGLTQQQIDQYVGEAKFFRAFAYFDLVRFWDHAPWRDETNMSDVDVACTNRDGLYTKIKEDLTDAIAKCPDTPAMLGRPGKNAARMLMADVLMTLNDFSGAETYVDAIISSGKHQLESISTMRDYDKIFGFHSGSSELIFSRVSCKSPAIGWTMLGMYAHPNMFVNGHAMENGKGWYAIDSGTDLKWYKEWDANDFRRDLNVIVTPKDFNPNAADKPDKFDTDPALNIPMNTITAKFYDHTATGEDGFVDYGVYRYAETLIMKAEILARNNKFADAIEYINKLHRRAYGKPIDTPAPGIDYAAPASLDEFMKILHKEHVYEFYGEHKRWPFLLRLGKDVAKQFIKEYKNHDITDSFWLWRIPESELMTNKALTPADQNPGY